MCDRSGDGDELTIPNDKAFVIDPNPVCDIAFFDDHGEVGRLTFGDNQIHFTGNADESAKLFFDWLKRHIDPYIEKKLKNESQRKTENSPDVPGGDQTQST